MITQNPITGRSHNKLAGVYARTLWGKNIIQSCPSPSKVAPTRALKDSRAAFACVTAMANMVPASLLMNIFYSPPVGRARRASLSSQLFAGVQRENGQISFNSEAITQLGSNPVSCTTSALFTVQTKNFQLPKSLFSSTTIADTSRVPLVFAISYDLHLCVPLLSYTEINSDNLVFSNISDTFIGYSICFICLWPINIGTTQTPIWVYGRFELVS